MVYLVRSLGLININVQNNKTTSNMLPPPGNTKHLQSSFGKKIRIVLAFGLRGFLKSVYFNLRILPFSQAIRLPILLSRHTSFLNCKRHCIEFENKPRTGTLRIGLNDLEYSYESKSFVSVQGKMIIKGSGYHVFGPGVSLNIWENGSLTLGDNFSVAPHLRLFVSNSIEIGDDNMWSFYNMVMDTDAHPIYNSDGILTNPPRKIRFGNKCWLGAYCKILKGADIPDGSIVGAGSTISKKLHSKNTIYLGTKVHRQDVYWKLMIL